MKNKQSKRERKLLKERRLGLEIGTVIFSVFVIFMGCMIIIPSLIIKNHTKETYYEMAQQVVIGRSDEITKWIDGYVNDLKVYSETDAAKTGDVEKYVDWMCSRPDLKNPAYDDLFFCDRDAIPYHDDGRIGVEGELRSKDYHHAIIFNDEETYIATIETSDKTGRYVLPISRAVKDEDENCFGYITGLLDMDQIAEEVGSYKVGENGYFFLTDRANTIIAHNNKEMISQDISVYHEIAITAKLAKENEEPSLYVESVVDGINCVTFVAPIQALSCTIGYTIPTSEVFVATKRIQMVILLMGISITLIICLIILISLRNIIGRVRKVDGLIDELSTGEADLTVQLEVNRNDEIGKLVISVNKFLAKFHSIMRNIKVSEENLTEAGDTLVNEIETTTSTISQMADNIGLVHNQVQNQSSSINSSASAMTQISKNIESLDGMIQGQASSVVEASASVEEMIGNINSVDKSVIKMVEEFTVLELDTKNGIEKNSSVNELIQKISEQSVAMMDANEMIQSIAEQTNLLAMNAAIEAAHAGEAGKGFSVVADEIRKLAETSAEQSNKISEELSNIQQGIQRVVVASSESEQSFQAVSSRINLTADLIAQIRGAMEEQQSGSQQILEALQAMNDSTTEVRGAGTEMSKGGEEIMKDVSSIQTSMDNIESAVAEINEGTNYVNESTKKLRNISASLNVAIKRIKDDVDLFKV
ncbi:MAG: HAMP domain-containing protein [Treponema sp.]|nr:HAMP domain-containing protein [Treponema sp.]